MTLDQIVGRVSESFAIAEGYSLRHDIPWNQKNPGDLTAGAHGSPTPNGKLTYTLHSLGWTDLENVARRIITGKDALYPFPMTWQQLAAKYTGNDNPQAWAATVCSNLACDPSMDIASAVTHSPHRQ